MKPKVKSSTGVRFEKLQSKAPRARFALAAFRQRPVWPRWTWQWAGPVLGVFLLLFLGYLLGFAHGSSTRGRLLYSDSRAGSFASRADFDLFWAVADIIQERYYGPLRTKDLVYGSVRGLVEALGDPYSAFDLPGAGRRFFQELAGNYEGVGLEMEYQGEDLVVIAPLQGSPAETAGLKAGDTVLAIDGEAPPVGDILGAIERIRGPVGSRVRLTVQRGDRTLDFEITRAVIHLRSVSLREEEGIHILSITKFVDDTEKLFRQAVNDLLQTQVQRVILDLRNNPGGLLQAAVQVANEFLPAGKKIVEERFKDGKSTIFTSDGSGQLANLQVVVLINGGTASAAEIVAGALRDNGRAVLVGERSFGKGTVQEVDEFADGSILKLTIAAWFTPRGESLEKGLKPDFVVTDDGAEEMVGKAKEILERDEREGL